MKKSNILIVGLVGLLLVCALTLASCDGTCSEDGKCVQKPSERISCGQSNCTVVKNSGLNRAVTCDCL